MTDVEMFESFRQLSTPVLRMKLQLGDFICNKFRDDPDPRRPRAIAALRHQQNLIHRVIAERTQAERAERGETEPESVVIAVRTLDMSGRAVPRE